MGLDYAWEKTTVAVTGMACDPTSINERIASAFTGSLIRINPDADLPADLRPLYAEIRTALTSTPAAGDEGSVAASARAMGTEQATDIARKIVDLYDKVCAAMPSH